MRLASLFRVGASLAFVVSAASTALAQSPEPTQDPAQDPETRQATIVRAVDEKANSAIAADLFSQYDLGYMPLRADGDGGFRHVAVRMRPQTNALARTRTGYIASSTRAAMAR